VQLRALAVITSSPDPGQELKRTFFLSDATAPTTCKGWEKLILAHQEIEWVILGRQIAGSMHVRILSRRYS
jgi:hypothetical protein